jgi:hypothetical protein
MKLWNPNETPIGGFTYHDPVFDRRITSDVNLDDLVHRAKAWYTSNGYAVPDSLRDYIEDIICQSQPPGKCYYQKKLGDTIALIAHKTAHAVDAVLHTNLEQKARECGGCGKRRRALNK